MKLTTEQKRLITVKGSPIEDVRKALDQFEKDLEKMNQAQRKMIKTLESTGFKELEERMRRSARQMGKSFENIEARMLITTAAERALFTNASQLGRNKSNLAYFTGLINSTDFLINPQVQIDKDYAEYCADLNNRPQFLAWCISQMHRPVTVNKTPNLGATTCFTTI